MAQVTPRFVWQNFFAFGNTLVSVSSEKPTAPKEWLKVSIPSQAWESKLGWNIVESQNDRIDLYEATTGAAVVTLDADNYATGDDLAAEIEDKLNDAATDNTYTVTYSSSTYKFTIAIDTGTTDFSLDWNSGSNKSRSVGPCIGFDEDADTSEDTDDKVSDNAVYCSQEWIKWDLSQARSLQAVLAYFNNLTEDATLTIQANSSDSWGSPAYETTLSGTSLLRAVNFSSQSYRYWRLLIEDQGNADGFVSIGTVFGAAYLQPGRAIQVGYGHGRNELTEVEFSDQGASFVNEKDTREEWSLTFSRLTKNDKVAIFAMADYLKVGKSFFFEFDPQNDLIGTTYYVQLMGGVSSQHHVGDGDPPERWTIQVRIGESLG